MSKFVHCSLLIAMSSLIPKQGSTLFYLALLVLPIVGGFLSWDYFGVQQGLLGAAVWLVLFGLIFVARVAFYSITLLPPDLPNRQEQAFNLILQHYLSPPPTAANGREWDGVPPSLDKFRAGVVDSHIVLALGRGEGFARAAGPGYIQLRADERIKHVLDLRHHQRQQVIQAVTRDGIPLKTDLTVVFRVRRQADEEAADNNPYPYDPSAIFQVSYFSTYGEGESEIAWTERVVPLAAAELIAEIANYTLDEVYTRAPFLPNSKTRLEPDKVEEAVQLRLQNRLLESGVEIVAIQLGNITLPENVNQQRIANWQAHWQRQSQVELARGDAAALQSMEQARAAAELDFIRQIMDTIEQNAPSGGWRLTDVVNLATVQALESGTAALTANAATNPEMPSQLMNTLAYLQEVASREE